MSDTQNAMRAASACLIGLCSAIQSMRIAELEAPSEGGPNADTFDLRVAIDATIASTNIILDAHPRHIEWNNDLILATLEPSLISRLDLAEPGSIKITDESLQLLIAYGEPDLVSLMISRGFGVGLQLPVLFRAYDDNSPSERVRHIADIITTCIAPFERARLNDGKNTSAWLNTEVITCNSPYFIDYFKAQATAFQDDLEAILLKAFMEVDYDILLRIHLAGFDLASCPSLATMEYAGVTKLKQMARSAHGQLEIVRHIGSLKSLVKNGLTARATSWLDRLGSEMENG